MNTQALLTLIKANEETPDDLFDMEYWVDAPQSFEAGDHPCHTAACLAGNYGLKTKRLGYTFASNVSTLDGKGLGYKLLAEEFGITNSEAVYLFSPFSFFVGPRGIKFEYGEPMVTSRLPRNPLGKEAAINRVRKFVYYKLRKRELCHEADGRVKESARQTEGNHYVCAQAKEDARVACLA